VVEAAAALMGVVLLAVLAAVLQIPLTHFLGTA